MFVIEDERHAEQIGKFHRLEDAIAELRQRMNMPWDQKPNVAPCTSWATCGRTYEIIEYDTSRTPWLELSRRPMLDVSAGGVHWLELP